MNTNPNWHVAFTRPNCERKTALQLQQKGFEAYCPYHLISDGHPVQNRHLSKPLFANYVFVFCTEAQVADVKKLNGVINILYRFDKPAVISKEEITTIKYVLGNYRRIDLHNTGIHAGTHALSHPENMQVFPLPSLGYSLLTHPEHETVRVPELLPETFAAIRPARPSDSQRGWSQLLKQLPSLFVMKPRRIASILAGRQE